MKIISALAVVVAAASPTQTEASKQVFIKN
jgi:hypothetical protein